MNKAQDTTGILAVTTSTIATASLAATNKQEMNTLNIAFAISGYLPM